MPETRTDSDLHVEVEHLRAEVDRLRAASTDSFWSMPAEDCVAAVQMRKKPDGPPIAYRRRLPDERAGKTAKFRVGPVEGYLTTGEFEDGSIGEVFARLDKDPGEISEDGVRDLIACRNALLDALMTVVSVALQVGVPLSTMASKFRHTRFSPAGMTGDPEVPRASSILDYAFARLSRWYGPSEAEEPAVTAEAAAGEEASPG